MDHQRSIAIDEMRAALTALADIDFEEVIHRIERVNSLDHVRLLYDTAQSDDLSRLPDRCKQVQREIASIREIAEEIMRVVSRRQS